MNELGRLHLIKFRLEEEKKNRVFSNGSLVNMDEKDIEWLISKVEELEEYENHSQSAIGDLSDHALKYRKALKFYADPKNHIKDYFEPLNLKAKGFKLSQIDLDDGDTARKALEDE